METNLEWKESSDIFDQRSEIWFLFFMLGV